MSNNSPKGIAEDNATNLSPDTSALALLRLVLSVLGIVGVETLSTHDVMLAIKSWHDMFVLMKRDKDGAYARIWWEALKLVYDPRAPVKDAAQFADVALNAFASRFPPMLDDDRPTYDDQDFADMRAELERQTIVAEGLANERDSLIADVNGLRVSWLQLQKANIGLTDQCDIMKKDNDSLLGIKREYDRLCDAIREHLPLLDSLEGDDGTMTPVVVAHGARIRALEKQLASAIVSLPKPERVEPGQRWAFLFTAVETTSDHRYYFEDPRAWNTYYFERSELFNRESAYYLGTEKV